MTGAPGGTCPHHDRGEEARGQPRDPLAPMPTRICRLGFRGARVVDIEARIAYIGQAVLGILFQTAAQGAPNVARRVGREA